MTTESTSQTTTVTAPQGYIGLGYEFPDPNPHDNPDNVGFFNFDFDLNIDTDPSQLAGTFFAFQVTFRDSSSGLPPNMAPANQGGYLGIQSLTPTEGLAIFSIFWAVDASAGPGATAGQKSEAWYLDGRPFDPPITDIWKSDPARPVAGGPFWTCRLPVTIAPNTDYRLRLWEVSEAGTPGQPEWWGAWIIDIATGHEQEIGRIQVPGSWGWLEGNPGGFIEQFGPMPNGCASIPPSHTTFANASGNQGAQRGAVSASVYGACQQSVQARTTIEQTASGCEVTVV